MGICLVFEYLLDWILSPEQILQGRGIHLDRCRGQKVAQQKIEERLTWVNISKRYSFTKNLISTHYVYEFVLNARL